VSTDKQTRHSRWYARDVTRLSWSPSQRRSETSPQAVESAVAFQNPYSGEWVSTERFNAIVEPERLAAQAQDGETDPLFNIPTDSYAIINPVDVRPTGGRPQEGGTERTISGQSGVRRDSAARAAAARCTLTSCLTASQSTFRDETNRLRWG